MSSQPKQQQSPDTELDSKSTVTMTPKRQVYRPRLSIDQPRSESQLQRGTIVEDTDSDTDTEFIVVKTPNKSAAEWNVPSRGRTVAEDNPSYPPDVPVVAVIPVEVQRRERPFYTGFVPLSLSTLSDDGITVYTFPEPRIRVVRRRQPPQIPIENIRPSPYSVRQFNPDEERKFINDTRRQGVPIGFPKVRPINYDRDEAADRIDEPARPGDSPDEPPRGSVVAETDFEIVDGHKRVWAARQAGLKMIPANVCVVDEKQAIDLWAKNHYADYTHDQQREVIDRLRSTFDADPCDLFWHISPPANDESAHENSEASD